MLQRREEGEGVLRGQETGVGAILTRVVGEDLTDTTTSEQRSEKRGRVNHMDIWEGKLFGGVSTPPSLGTVASNQGQFASTGEIKM